MPRWDGEARGNRPESLRGDLNYSNSFPGTGTLMCSLRGSWFMPLTGVHMELGTWKLGTENRWELFVDLASALVALTHTRSCRTAMHDHISS